MRSAADIGGVDKARQACIAGKPHRIEGSRASAVGKRQISTPEKAI
ncbi:MAG: hypothetical protein Q4A65_06665 [Bacillota bacterium]|nr:hypothetical protein [Bacillota bacterium]